MSQAIAVHARLGFEDERFVFQSGEVLGRAVIDGLRVRIGRGRQLDLRARYAQKTQRIAFRQRSRFFGADDVVGHGRDPPGVGRPWTQRAERMQGRHGVDKLCHEGLARPWNLWRGRDSCTRPANKRATTEFTVVTRGHGFHEWVLVAKGSVDPPAATAVRSSLHADVGKPLKLRPTCSCCKLIAEQPRPERAPSPAASGRAGSPMPAMLIAAPRPPAPRSADRTAKGGGRSSSCR